MSHNRRLWRADITTGTWLLIIHYRLTDLILDVSKHRRSRVLLLWFCSEVHTCFHSLSAWNWSTSVILKNALQLGGSRWFRAFLPELVGRWTTLFPWRCCSRPPPLGPVWASAEPVPADPASPPTAALTPEPRGPWREFSGQAFHPIMSKLFEREARPSGVSLLCVCGSLFLVTLRLFMSKACVRSVSSLSAVLMVPCRRRSFSSSFLTTCSCASTWK